VIYLGAMLVSGLALAGMFGSSACEPTNPSGIESVTQIKLPPSATNLESTCAGLQGVGAAAAFDMKPSELALFVNSTHVKLPLSATGKPETLKCLLCSALPDVKSYLYGTYSRDEWFEEIFIDTSNPAQYRVYFTLLAG
jgi:hypothetical protein